MPEQQKIGILIANLGTPDATDYLSVRKYLKQFLSDQRVIERNPYIWKPLLNGLLLQIIPQRSAKNYRKIWNTDLDESPLLTYTRAQGDAMAEKFQSQYGDNVQVTWSMRYGEPSIETRIQELESWGCTHLVFLPLYPQYSATTVGSANDMLFDALKKVRRVPRLRIIDKFYDQKPYLDTLTKHIKREVKKLPFTPDVLLCSYHGLPTAYVEKGDPYPLHCEATTQYIKERLKKEPYRLEMSYQSKFGNDGWLTPATDERFDEMPKEGVKRLAVVAPAFISDCVETLEELKLSGFKEFIEAGGEEYGVIPCLNASEATVDMLKAVVENEIADWLNLCPAQSKNTTKKVS